MVSDRAWRPDWRDERSYESLVRAEGSVLAWEWLRRDRDYRTAARVVPLACTAQPAVLAAQGAAARWGLHAFADPALSAAAARPVWRKEWLRRVLPAAVVEGGAADDRFDLGRFAAIATLVSAQDGLEHLLLADGGASLRIDVTGGSLLAGPVRLAYGLTGLAALPGPLEALHALVRLWRSGRLDRPEASSRNKRLVLLLRAGDALEAGATQREIAAVLLSREASRTRWRSETPSLRSRAQRLVTGARSMQAGGWRRLLGS